MSALKKALAQKARQQSRPAAQREVKQATSEPPEVPLSLDTWPAAPSVAAFHGLAGEFVELVEPHTEADPAGLLIQFLVGIGSGLSSGEGLIWQVRNPIEQQQPIKEKGRVVGNDMVTTDPGVSDKRLMVIEEEFVRVLASMGRETNTLSPVLRQSWDSGDLRTMTKSSPARPTGAHISIVAHVTRDELRRAMAETEHTNGFANRFLWACVRRSKSLPEGAAFTKSISIRSCIVCVRP